MRRVIVAALLVGLAANALAQDVADAPLYDGRSAAEWTAQLPSNDVAERQKAAYALWNLRADADGAALALVTAIADDDAYVRTTAAKAVLRLGDAARASAVSGVAAHLSAEREEVRREAATLMWRLGPLAAQAVPALTTALASDDAVVRANAAGALGNAGEAARPALDTLLHVAARDDDTEARRWAGKTAALLDPARALTYDHREVRLAAVLTWADASHRGWEREDVCELLVRMVVDQDEDEQVREALAHTLDTFCAFAGDGRPVAWIPVFRRVLEHDRAPAVRARGAYGLGRYRGHASEVVPILIKAAQSPEPEVQRSAVLVLGWFGGEARAAVPLVLRAIASQDMSVRAAGVVAIQGLGDRSDTVIDAVVGVLDSDDRSVRSNSISALGALGNGSVRAEQALLGVFADSERPKWQRGAAAEALAAMGASERAFGPLTEAFDGDEDAHSAICYALVALGAPNADAAMERLIARLGSDPEPYQELSFVERLGPRAATAVPMLARLIDSEDLSVRFGAIGTLPKLGPAAAEAIPALEAACDDPNAELAAAAREALAAIRELQQNQK